MHKNIQMAEKVDVCVLNNYRTCSTVLFCPVHLFCEQHAQFYRQGTCQRSLPSTDASSLPAPPPPLCSIPLINDNPDPNYEQYVLLSEESNNGDESEQEETSGKSSNEDDANEDDTNGSNVDEDPDTDSDDNEGNGYVICRKKFHVPLYADDASAKIGNTFRVREKCQSKVDFFDKCPVGKIVHVVRKKGALDKTVLYYKFYNYLEHRRPPSQPSEYSYALCSHFLSHDQKKSVSLSGIKS